MCGIELFVLKDGSVQSLEEFEERFKVQDVLRKRGPDYQAIKEVHHHNQHLCWLRSTVLHMRGINVTPQPLSDDPESSIINSSFLQWNGEIFSGNVEVPHDENDGKHLFHALKCAAQSDDPSNAIVELISNVHGPYALCFFDVGFYFGSIWEIK